MDREININEVLNLFWQKKFLIITVSFVFALISAIYSLAMPNKYFSSVTLTVSEKSSGNSGLSSFSSQYGNLASLAGINLGPTSDGKLILAQKIINSRDFVKRLISFKNVLPNIIAAKSYDLENDFIKYHDDVFDSKKGVWTYKPRAGKKIPPSYLEAHKIYSEEILYVDYEEDDPDYLIVGIQHVSPKFSKAFLEMIVKELNKIKREKDLEEAEKALTFLEEQLKKTQNIETVNSISQLIESQLKIKMLANVREDYLVTVIDEPFIPETKFSPRRSLITIIGFLIGFVLSLVYVTVKKYVFFQEVQTEELKK